MDKLEILNQFKKKYGDMINPELKSVKYCQTKEVTSVRLAFRDHVMPKITINLFFLIPYIDPDDESANDCIPKLILPELDVVDNAKVLVEYDAYALSNLVNYLFTNEAITKINKQHNPFNLNDY